MNVDKMQGSEKYFFIGVVVVSVVVAYILVGPLLSVVAAATVVAMLIRPIYLKYAAWLKDKQGLATTLTIITFILLIIVPGTIILLLSIKQGQQIADDLSMWVSGQDTSGADTLAKVNDALSEIPVLEDMDVTGQRIVELAQSAVQSIVDFLVGLVSGLFSSIAGLVMKVVLFLAVLGALLPGWPGLMRLLKTLSPLRDELDQIYIDRFELVSGSVVTAVLVSMVAQGATMTFFLGVAGIPYLFFWFILCTVLAILPTGDSIVAFPIGITLILTGHTWEGLVVILGYVLVTANVGPVVQATMVPQEATANPAVTLLSVFGGFILLGAPGAFYGVIVMALAMATLQIYIHYFANRDSPAVSEDMQEPESLPSRRGLHS